MNYIYCKETHISNTKTRKGFVKKFLEELPTTYDDKECKKIQCYSGRARSISDLHAIVKSRFPKTSVKAVIDIVKQLNEKGKCDMVWCRQTEKFVVRQKNWEGKLPLVTKYSQDNYKNRRGIDGISFDDLYDPPKEFGNLDNPVPSIPKVEIIQKDMDYDEDDDDAEW